VQTIRRSYSLSDLSEPDTQRSQDEIDELTKPAQRILRSKTTRSSSGSRQVDMYFPEVNTSAVTKHRESPPVDFR
jgi:receptor expression-enhancing protein 1/2/3/4